MMFWLAETAGVDDATLSSAEAAAEAAAAAKGHDCPEHGAAMRAVLPWPLVEGALLRLPPLDAAQRAQARRAVEAAHAKLVGVLGSRYA